jgi:hypothetical protein
MKKKFRGAQDQKQITLAEPKENQTNFAQGVIGDIPTQIANIEYKVTISGRTPSSRYQKREKKRRER